MKISANAQVIQEGINIVTRALPSKAPKQIFEGIHFEADNDTLTLTCSDGQFTIRWTGNVTVNEPGDAIIPGRMLSDLVRKLPNTPTTIKSDDSAALITYGKSRSRISVIGGIYPESKQINSPFTFTIPMIDFKDQINHISTCIATDESRPILTGGLLELTSDAITMVALDGFRLALKRIAQDNDLPDNAQRIRSVIPRKALTELARIIPNTEDTLTINAGTDSIMFDLGNTQISSVLLSGEYMDYSRIIPTDFKSSLRLDKSPLQNAIDRASLMAREGRNNLIRFDVSSDSISISANSETGNVVEELPCLTNGDNISIAFNSNYLIDAIKSAPGDTVTLHMQSPVTPCIISPESGNDWLYLILPVRTN